jgi:hypothetical protein
MEPKKYGRDAFIDMCGGTEEATKVLFPNYILKDDGLWLDRHAGDNMATNNDLPEARGPMPDLEALAARRLEAERGGWSWNPAKNSGVPALPFSFTSYQLAALMLAGDGMDLFDYFDFGTVVHEDRLRPLPHDADDERRALRADYIAELRSVETNSGGKFEAALRSLGENADDAREVLREALPLRRQADIKFGRDDKGVRKSADWLLNDAHRELIVESHQAPAISAIDTSMLATRAQLIAAFGTFSGMNIAWFKNLKDVPALLDARKVDGRGQRGRSVEPLFCPMEVMNWLMDPKRKKGRKFHSDEKPWELLERHFPMLYSKHSAGDPRQD